MRYSQDAISGNPDLDEIFVYEKAKHRPDRSRLLSLYKQLQVELKLKKMRFDLVVGMRSAFSWSEAWLVYFTGAPFRLGCAPTNKGDQKFAFFYNLKVPPSPPEQHEVEKALGLLNAIGVLPGEKNLHAAIPEEDRHQVDSFFRNNKIDPDKLVGFHLSSRIPANRWSADNFANLAMRLIREDKQFVVLTWGPGDEALAKAIRARVGEGVFLFVTPNFKRLGALQERCRVFISPDGGPMHFSTAVGTPTVGLFGKTDPRMWGPWGDGHVALRKGNHADLILVEEVYRCLKKWIKD